MTQPFNADWQYSCPACGGSVGVRKTQPGRMPARLYQCPHTVGCDGLPVRTALTPELVSYLYLEPSQAELYQLEPWQKATVEAHGYCLKDIAPQLVEA